MKLPEYYEKYGSRISQESERLFIDEFLYPLLGSKIEKIVPQHPFLDRTGRSRRIDFAVPGTRAPLALEVNGETYHAEGIIPDAIFDENLFRQNEILRLGYHLARFSYSQLKDPKWRPLVMDSLREAIAKAAPELLSEYALQPTELQTEALDALTFYRDARAWRKGVVVMPTGTGKTILSALDARRVGGKVLFLVHRLDILSQSIGAYHKVWPEMTAGHLTGEVREKEKSCDVLFASKDTLRQPDQLIRFSKDEFDYIVVDEVHHGQSPTYRDIIEYFRPKFMLGMTATPDRLDRKDIFELFDYNKVYEITASEVIERGLLVPYTYYGLTDDIDYSKIRYQSNRYRVDDLERYLIIPERNAAILHEYREKGQGDKAIGFCVSIKHAERMAEYFTKNGVVATAIHSLSPNRDQLIEDFRNDKIAVAFTVGFVYCGANGIVLGVLTVTKGVVRGSDYAGGKYDGAAQENADGTIDLTLSLEVRAGVTLVQGTAAQDVPHTRQINAHLPPHFGDGEPQEIASPPGTVTVMFKRVSDEFAPAATEGFTVTTARRLAAPES